MTKTQEILQEMLKENTGRSMLDSGGAYGRNWERNQGVDFMAQPESVLDFCWGLSVTHNVFHWLTEKLDYAPELDAAFHGWAESSGECWLEDMKKWVEDIVKDERREPATGLYGEGNPITINTYNNEDLLSQIIQYIYFELDGTGYVILQIHGGCDARGGYGTPHVLEVCEECGIFDNARASICCESRKHRWFSDDGYSWSYEPDNSDPGPQNIHDTECYELQEGESPLDIIERKRTASDLQFEERDAYCKAFLDAGKSVPATPEPVSPWVIPYDGDTGQGYCPVCGEKLSSWFF